MSKIRPQENKPFYSILHYSILRFKSGCIKRLKDARFLHYLLRLLQNKGGVNLKQVQSSSIFMSGLVSLLLFVFLIALVFKATAFDHQVSTNPTQLMTSSHQQATQNNLYYLEPRQELLLLKKVLSFERNWKARAGNKLIIGLLYQKSSSLSLWVVEDWLNLYAILPEADKQIDGIPISLQEISLDSVSSLEKELAEKNIQLLYVAPLDDKKSTRLLKDIEHSCEKLKIGTFTGVPQYLDSGVAISFELKENKAQILINLEAARAQGLNFSSQFLRLAKIRGKND